MILEQFRNITTFVFDMDGVLTDGMLFVFNNGEQVRRMNIKDGYALQLAIKKGYRIAIISGSDSPAVSIRLNKLGISDIYMKEENKMGRLLKYMEEHQLTKQEVLFMGDDIPDYEVMQYCGLACCPADAAGEIKRISKYISPVKGGEGCVRDVIEKVLKINNHWRHDADIVSK